MVYSRIPMRTTVPGDNKATPNASKSDTKSSRSKGILTCPFRMTCLACGFSTTRATKLPGREERSSKTHLGTGVDIERFHVECPGCKASIIIGPSYESRKHRHSNEAKKIKKETCDHAESIEVTNPEVVDPAPQGMKQSTCTVDEGVDEEPRAIQPRKEARQDSAMPSDSEQKKSTKAQKRRLKDKENDDLCQLIQENFDYDMVVNEPRKRRSTPRGFC